MLKKTTPLIFFCVFLGLSAWINPLVKEIREKYLQETYTSISALPSPALQALTLEFKGTAANLLFLKTMTFMGYNIGENILPEEKEWQLISDTLDRITDLDPRFWDPYVFAETILGWQAGRLEDVNRLLHKATKARPNDYRPLYYLGFNKFYFERNAAEAAPFLREAAKRPNAHAFIQGLASRMSLYGSQTIAGILFLEELLHETYDPIVKQQLEFRLSALKSIHTLEKAVHKYRNVHKRLPASLQVLVTDGLLDAIPKDPYGGDFIILKNGRIYTTSSLLPAASNE